MKTTCRAMLGLAACASLLVFLCGGCISAAPVREVHFYDLGPPPVAKADTVRPEYLRVAAFTAAWPARQRLVQREDPYSVTLDEYHRWVAPPEQLLAQRMQAALTPWFRRVGGESDEAGELTVEGRLLAFERVGDEAVLTLEINLLDRQRRLIWRRHWDERQALAAGVTLAGCTAHLVCEEVDAGRILVQAAVPVLATDDHASLSARIQRQEHRILPLAVALAAQG